MLAGGVGAAKFLRGLIQVVDPSALTIVVNTGDDERFFGLAVSPDLDTVTYTLAGAANPRRGWGLRSDSFACHGALRRFFPGSTWFHLGDRDLATHIYRTKRLAEGATLTAVTSEICRVFGVGARVLPMSDDRVSTALDTPGGRLTFQRYFVARRALPRVRALHYLGATRAHPAPGVLRAIRDAAAVIIAPSNPYFSIGPILAVPGVRRALAARRQPVGAVCPIIGNRAVSGPLDRLLRAFGKPVSASGVASLYRPFLNVLAIDRRDRAQVRELEDLGCRIILGNILFDRRSNAERLARRLLTALELA